MFAAADAATICHWCGLSVWLAMLVISEFPECRVLLMRKTEEKWVSCCQSLTNFANTDVKLWLKTAVWSWAVSRLSSLPQWDSCVILTQQWLSILLFEPGYSAQFKLLVIITSVTDMTFTAHWSIWPSPNNHQRQSESGKIWSLLIHHHHHKLLQTWKTATRGANTRLFPSGIYNGHQSF